MQIDALLLVHVSLLLGLLEFGIHHSKDLRVLLKISNGFLGLDLAVLGGVRQPRDVELQFIILILELLEELRGLLLKHLGFLQLRLLLLVLLLDRLQEHL